MTTLKPILIGMNNPVTPGRAGAARYALWPDPPGCAGHRLWSVLRDASSGRVSRNEYAERFDRMNLVEGTWSMRVAQARAAQMIVNGVLLGRQVVLLGVGVRDAFRHRPAQPGEMYERDGTCFWQMPHPSGRNLWYNDPAHRAAVGAVLVDLYDGAVRL